MVRLGLATSFMKIRLRNLLLVILLLAGYLAAMPSRAGIYFEDTLSFGTVVVRNNNIKGSVTVPRVGHSSSSGGVLIIQPGRPAELVFTDYYPYIELTVTPMLPVTTGVASGETEQFVLDKIDLPDFIRTDAAGVAKVKMGGRITTSGNGKHYHNASYKAIFHLVVSY